MMRAMQLDRPGEPLRMVERPVPVPGRGELLIEVAACGICRTDLHIVDGDIRGPLPIVPGHEIVGRVAGTRERVGVPWLGGTCAHCPYCRSDRETLCAPPAFPGSPRAGGFASHVVADARFCLPGPGAYGDAAAPRLLCGAG